MRPERSWYHATLVGSFLALAAYARAIAIGAPEAVRYGWMDAAPAMISITALLGLAFHAWRGPRDAAGKCLAAAALGALATHFLLVLAVPLAPHEPGTARVWPALDVLAWATLPAGVLVATEARASPRVAERAVLAVGVVAVLLAARLLWSAFALPLPMRVGIAVSWSSFVAAGGWAVTKLLLARVRSASPRATPP